MVRKVALNVFLTAMFGIAGLMLVPAALGLHRYVILTGSMTGTYDPGSIVFDKQVRDLVARGRRRDHLCTAARHVAEPRAGHPPDRANRPGPRRAARLPDKGRRQQDSRPLALRAPRDRAGQGRVQPARTSATSSPSSASREFRMALIGAPALLVALWIIIGMWRDAGEIVRRRERGVAWSTVSASRTPNLGPANPGGRGSPAASGAVALPMTWGRPAPRRHGPAPVMPTCIPDRGRSGRVPLPATCLPRVRARRVEVPIVLPARLRSLNRARRLAFARGIVTLERGVA